MSNGTTAQTRIDRSVRAASARKAVLRGGTALVMIAAASAASAQCADPQSNGGIIPGLPRTFGLPISSTVSGVQSLVSVLTTQNTAFLTQTSSFIGAPANPPEDTNGGGVWIRGIGGTFDTNVPGSFVRNPAPTAPDRATGSCNVRTFQDYAGFQTGADIARLNVDGWNIHAGVTMGYTETSTQSNGSFQSRFQTPFVGVYGAVTKGTFFADGQLRWDFFQGVLNDANNALTNQRLDARSLSISGNVGYQFPLTDGWFVEPSAGAVYAEAKVDPLQTAGEFFLLTPAASFSAPTTVRIRDFDSILARGSVRFGKNVIVDGYALQPFVTASVINEFAGPVRTDVSTNFAGTGAALGLGNALAILDQTGRVTTGRIGTYGQFSAGVAGQLLNTGWLGYVRGDYRTGDRVEGWGISGGVRYQFTPDAVRALITKGDRPAPAFVDGPINWTGISVGASVGGLWGQTKQITRLDPADPVSVNGNFPHEAGLYAGGQIGADYQFQNFVVGVAGDGGWTNARGGSGCSPSAVGNFFNCQTNTDTLYMATGRVGYAIGRTLFYAKGGAAFADTSEKSQNNLDNRPTFFVALAPNASVRAFSTGWTVGAGFEYMLTRNWSAKAEYMHYDLDRETYRQTPANFIGFTSAQHTGDIVKVGVNYRFGAPVPEPVPVIAKN